MRLVVVLSSSLLVLWLADVEAALDGAVFARVIDELASDSLGLQQIQNYLDTGVGYKPPTRADGDAILKKITDSMRPKFQLMNQAVEQIRDRVEQAFSAGNEFTRRDTNQEQYEPCCLMTDLNSNPSFPNLTVNVDKMCVVGPTAGLEFQDTEYPVKDAILEAAKLNLDRIPELKWQYVALEKNYVINYPAAKICWPNYEPRLRPWYKETASAIRKDVVIVFDVSRSMVTLLDQAKAAVKAVLQTLGPNDRIGLVAFDAEAKTPESHETTCYSTKLARTISENIPAMEGWVDSLRATVGESVYSKAFHKAFQYFINSQSQGERDKVILFVSDGRPTDDSDPARAEQTILDTIREENVKLQNQVIIQTFGIDVLQTDEGPRQLMTNIANQIRADDSVGEVAKGEYRPVSDVQQLREMMATFYSRPAFSTNSAVHAVYTVPYHDGFGFGIVLTACLPIHRSGHTFEGVACVDMLMRDLIGDLTAFQHLDVAYTFMLDGAGRYVYHPLLPLSLDKDDPAVYADFTVLERAPSALQVRDGMLGSGTPGSVNITTQYVIPRGTTQRAGADHVTKNLNYYWRSIPDTGFSVCVVLDESERYTDFATPTMFPRRVLFHRTDLTTNPPHKCNNFNKAVFKDNVTLVLTEKAFRIPASYDNLETVDREGVRDIAKYLETGSPGYWTIKPEVRNTVAVLYDKLTEIWTSSRSASNEYTMSRYVGIRDGVFLMIPGDRSPHYYDHTVRSWYVKAKHSSGRFALVGPYKDASSGDMVVTLGKTITISGDQILGVAAMDFSLNHLFYHLSTAYEKCDSDDYKCMILDDNGMVILHGDFIDDPPDDLSKIANVPLVMKEPDIARELFEKNVITRNECFNSKTIKYQHFLKVSIPSGGSSVSGDFFDLFVIPDTNFFIIIKDSRFTGFRQCFCGVNVDESGTPTCTAPDDCECACHDKAEYDYCENQLPSNIEVPLPCYPDAPSYPFEDLVEKERSEVARLQPCYKFNCPAKDTRLSCEGVFSCSWCDDACKTTSECKPAPPPPGKEPSLEDPGDGGSRGAPIGAVAGGVVAGVAVVILLVILLVVLIYRRRQQQRANPSSGSSSKWFQGNTQQGYPGANGGYPAPTDGSSILYNLSTGTASTYIEPDYQDLDEAQRAATLPPGVPGFGPPGGPPTLDAGSRAVSGPPTIDPYAVRPLPSLPKSRTLPAGLQTPPQEYHTPPPGLPRVRDFYNNPRDLRLEAEIAESPPSQIAPDPPSVEPQVATSQEIIDEIKQGEKNSTNNHKVASVDFDDDACHSIPSGNESEPETEPNYKNTSELDQESPYKNVVERSPSSESGYQIPAELQGCVLPPQAPIIARLSAEEHPKPPPVPPPPVADEIDGNISGYSSDSQVDPHVDPKYTWLSPLDPSYANALKPTRPVPRPPSFAPSEGPENEEVHFQNPEVLEDLDDEDFGDRYIVLSDRPASQEFYL